MLSVTRKLNPEKEPCERDRSTHKSWQGSVGRRKLPMQPVRAGLARRLLQGEYAAPGLCNLAAGRVLQTNSPRARQGRVRGSRRCNAVRGSGKSCRWVRSARRGPYRLQGGRWSGRPNGTHSTVGRSRVLSGRNGSTAQRHLCNLKTRYKTLCMKTYAKWGKEMGYKRNK